MKPAAKQIESKATRYIIGASILLLALMLFSELICSLLGLCSKQFPLIALFGFWEMLGITTALLFTSLSIRTLRRRHQVRHPEAQTVVLPEPHAFASDRSASEHSQPKRSSRWRDLFNQLSDDEKRKLKTIMEQHCIPPSDITSSDRSPGENLRNATER